MLSFGDFVQYILLLPPLFMLILFFLHEKQKQKIDSNTDTDTEVFCQISTNTDRTLNCQTKIALKLILIANCKQVSKLNLLNAI